MQPFTLLTAPAIPLDQVSVDTDQIIPARFLGKSREEQAAAMFHDLRFDADGSLRAGVTLNDPAYAHARIMVCAENFGCGSSRESAVTAMLDNGILAFIAPSFGDIFFNNCFQNGALPIRLPAARVAELRAALHARPGTTITIDLPRQTVMGPDGNINHFDIDPFRKDCLIQGVDEIDLTLSYEADICRFEVTQAAAFPWLAPLHNR